PGAPQWLAYDFGSAVDVAVVAAVYHTGALAQAPAQFTIEYSVAGTNWPTMVAPAPAWGVAPADRTLSFSLRRRFAGYITELQRNAQDNEKFAISVSAVG